MLSSRLPRSPWRWRRAHSPAAPAIPLQPSAYASFSRAQSTASPAACGWKWMFAISTKPAGIPYCEKSSRPARTSRACRGVQVKVELVNADPPAQCAPHVVDALIKSCDRHHLQFERMISRAYHDSLFMSRIAPTAMLFIPCRGGVSHRPDEYASPEAIAQGTLVLAETLALLSDH